MRPPAYIYQSVLYFQLRRENCRQICDFELVVALEGEVVVLVDPVLVGSAVDLEELHVLGLERDGHVVGRGEEGPVEVLEQVLLEVGHLHRAEVVEALHAVQSFSQVDDRNSSEMPIVTWMSFLLYALDEVQLGRQRVVAHVREHHQAVLRPLLALRRAVHVVLQGLDALVEARGQRGRPWS